jgi:hypothetical protein
MPLQASQGHVKVVPRRGPEGTPPRQRMAKPAQAGFAACSRGFTRQAWPVPETLTCSSKPPPQRYVNSGAIASSATSARICSSLGRPA